MSVKIYDTDTVEEIAEKIFNYFDVGASCTVSGFEILENGVVAKGELVLKELERLDEINNCRYAAGKKIRNYKYKKNSIGGTIAQKIFSWDKRISDKEPKYTIWRFQ